MIPGRKERESLAQGGEMNKQEERLGLLLFLPSLLLVLLVAFFPIVRVFFLSLHRIQLQLPQIGQPFVGMANYLSILQLPRFWQALGNTLLFTVVTVSLEFLIGLGLALLMNLAFKGRDMVRTVILIPWALTTVVSALMWQFLYHDSLGILNHLLTKAGAIETPVVWLGTPVLAMASCIVADVWKTTPFIALLLLAGLQNISQDLYEAVSLDGAGRWQAFWKITLPLLKPAILVSLLFRTTDAFRIFDLIYVLTNGGPGNSTETLSLFIYNTMFREFNFGLGSSLSVIIFLLTLFIGFFYIKGLGAKIVEV